MGRIVGVHGIGNYLPEPPVLAAQVKTREWAAALAGSPFRRSSEPDADVRVAYYADLLQPPGRQGGPELDQDAESMFLEFLKDWIPEGAQGSSTWLLRLAASRLADAVALSPAAAFGFLSAFFPEVAAFLRVEGAFTPKHHVLARVASELAGAEVVIAHSLGSVVAYEALWKYGIEVPLLVTLGSPLAMPTVFGRLTPAPVGALGARPPGVGRWVNIADRGDLVAVPPGGMSKRFDGVDVDVHDTIGAFDFHRVAKYLRCRELDAALHDRAV
ncbi:hypothetical protein [Glycomyces harbinensis]|uniref:Serine peptidase n=1 Tax=Glycomyces harbinensis TaxID=58114 RepID=A0A1G7A255_9ACTN|nr:hypothetical protein [Glycomyces harbinensis]SDE08984.1 hypothetical protein SAMN05216270_112108 [Glycomyces harbinensis]